MKKLRDSTHAKLIRKVVELLPEKTYNKLVLLIGFQIIATFLDILALLLLGLLTKTGIEIIKGVKSTVSIPHFDFAFFESSKLEQQFVALA